MQSLQTCDVKSGSAVVFGGGDGGFVVKDGGKVVVGTGGELVSVSREDVEELEGAIYVESYTSALNGVAKLDGRSESTYGSEGVGGSS